MKNWLLYYPIEKWLSRYTDVLITINQEDYTRAKNRFSMKKVEYIPGIGIDVEKFQQSYEKVNSIKNELSVSNGKTLILSVGELNQNKNHELIIRAIADVDHVYYAIAGKGSNQSYLESLIKKLNLQNRVFLLGYREDIPQLNQAADLFAFPSIREGLGLAAIEALASGTPVVGMNTGGINEYVIEGETGFLFDNNVESCKKSIQKFLQLEFSELSRIQANCYDKAKEYSKMRSSEIMKRIYENI